MNPGRGEARRGLLDPIDRISEILFGLIMAVTIVGSLSIAAAGRSDVREVLAAALGCNLAWGLVDAVMYVVRTVTERTRNRMLARWIADADAEHGRRLLAEALPPGIAALAGPAELDGMRARLTSLDPDGAPVLGGRDWLEAIGIFLLVVLATFPVVVPFLFIRDVTLAMHVSQGVAVAMLFICGWVLGRHAGHRNPWLTGAAMAVFGTVLVGVVKALGG